MYGQQTGSAVESLSVSSTAATVAAATAVSTVAEHMTVAAAASAAASQRITYVFNAPVYGAQFGEGNVMNYSADSTDTLVRFWATM